MSQVAVVHYQNIHFDYYCIIPHPIELQVLVLAGEDGWSLPRFVPYEHHFGMVGHINQTINEQLGLNVTTLRCFYEDYCSDTNTGCRVYAMENHSLDWMLPQNTHWVKANELDRFVVIPKLRQVLNSWFAEIQSGFIPEIRVPWAKLGWFDKASTWINRQLDALSLSVTAPIRQVKSQTRSCLLRVETTIGTLYLKAGCRIFGREATFTDFLAQLYPDCLPKLVAVDAEQQWMLMRDFESQHLGKTADISRWEEALRLYAEMQVRIANKVGQLLDVGFPDRRINQLAQKIEPLFADDAILLIPQDDPFLSQSDLKALRTLIPQLISWCEVLETCGVPQTLVHGDFYCQNVIDTQKRYIYFDWSDSAVSHPFFDAGFFLLDIAQELPNVMNVQARLRDAYLEPWTVYLPMEQLTSLFKLAQPLAALYHAIVSYEIIQHLEAAHRWETENTVSYYLKTMLKQLSLLSTLQSVNEASLYNSL